MVKSFARTLFVIGCLASGTLLANAQSEMEKSKKQVCLDKCNQERQIDCMGGTRLDPFASKERKIEAVKFCDRQLSTCRGNCGSYEGTRVKRR